MGSLHRRGNPRAATEGTEGEGFEPSDDVAAVNSFQGCRIQPLCHPSG
jgi:hypothetical protein